MPSHVVLGLGFGDEGKGLVTDLLSYQHSNALVIRFCGGHQAGHTVVDSAGNRHVFSSFGAGTLRNVPTYWSSFCTFSPDAAVKEYEKLVSLGKIPLLFVDKLALVTTFYDLLFNRLLEKSRTPHGSCGVGFGTTIERNERFCKFFVQDLLHPAIAKVRLKVVRQYYENQLVILSQALQEEFYSYSEQDITDTFLANVEDVLRFTKVVSERDFFEKSSFENYIFEGAQGILLDMDFGFFPNVTRSSTTSKNALSLIKNNHLPKPEIYYVTRAYQTRHGAGYMTNESLPLKLQLTGEETNVFNPYQGAFRKSVLDIDLLNYALDCDKNYSQAAKNHLVLTCLDQMGETLTITENQCLQTIHYQHLPDRLLVPFEQCFYSFDACGEYICT